jgi:peptidoglycan hydrolase CwlO-like protein
VPKRARTWIVAFAAAGSALALGSLAGAAPSDTEQKLDSARAEARLITDRISSQSASIAELEAEGDRAAERERELLDQLRDSTARSTALNDDLLAAEDELEVVRARYKRSVGILADRLVAIYKGTEPDYLTVLLSADGFDELETRAEYLEALTAADERIAERVSALHDQVSAAYEQIADLKASIDQEARRLEASRAEVEAARAGAKRRAAEIADARAAEREALAELQEQISGWELEVRKEAAEQLGDGAFLGGPYSIPTYIVMCESGGNYRALNPSSGAGGAYQIIPSTWRSYGGSGLAHQAPKAEQDRIAAMIWRDSGPSAWSCA